MDKPTDNALLLVNYHYVRERAQYPHPGIHPIEPDEFMRQLSWLKSSFHMASPEEVEAFAHGARSLPAKSVFLTFDDGLVDHIEVARKYLNPLKVRAAFFVCSRPILDKKAIMVHKTHWLRATTKPEDFARDFANLLPEKWKSLTDQSSTAREALETYVYDTPEDARIKYLINFQLPAEVVDAVTSEMLAARGIADEKFCRDLYMDDGQVNELAQDGHIVGSHGHTHTPFARLDEDELGREIETNLSCIEGITRRRPTWVSYPYGSPWAIPDNAGAFCRRFGFSIGITLKRGWNDGSQPPWSLNRINTNEVSTIAA